MDSLTSSWRRKTQNSYEWVHDDVHGRQNGDSRTLQINTGITRPKLLNKEHQGKAIDRFGVSWEKAVLYWGDLFHTLLNMPRWRFVAIFFTVYVVEYVLFALLYLSQPNSCVPHIKRLSVALWFSVQTAATIGYGAPLAPNPECTFVNVIIMLQVITASLIDYCCMGLVFARFSAPSKRSSSMRFSTSLVLAPHAPTGYWALCLRVANMRKHIMIRPEVLLAKPDNPGQSAFDCQLLPLEDSVSNMANLRLGMAVTMMHVIRPGSPLWELSVDDLLLQEMEVMVFFEGVDAMTSNSVQARYSYYPTDMRMNERFATLYMMYKGQRLGLDFTEFDATVKLGAPAASATMRRQKFCNLTAAAQQQLEAEATSKRPRSSQQQHSSSRPVNEVVPTQEQDQHGPHAGQAPAAAAAVELAAATASLGSPPKHARHNTPCGDIELLATSHEL